MKGTEIMNKLSQKQQILEWLQSGRSITPMDALNSTGSFRLGARIKDLKDDGYAIVNLNKTGGTRYARYSLINNKLPQESEIDQDQVYRSWPDPLQDMGETSMEQFYASMRASR